MRSKAPDGGEQQQDAAGQAAERPPAATSRRTRARCPASSGREPWRPPSGVAHERDGVGDVGRDGREAGGEQRRVADQARQAGDGADEPGARPGERQPGEGDGVQEAGVSSGCQGGVVGAAAGRRRGLDLLEGVRRRAPRAAGPPAQLRVAARVEVPAGLPVGEGVSVRATGSPGARPRVVRSAGSVIGIPAVDGDGDGGGRRGRPAGGPAAASASAEVPARARRPAWRAWAAAPASRRRSRSGAPAGRRSPRRGSRRR